MRLQAPQQVRATGRQSVASSALQGGADAGAARPWRRACSRGKQACACWHQPCEEPKNDRLQDQNRQVAGHRGAAKNRLARGRAAFASAARSRTASRYRLRPNLSFDSGYNKSCDGCDLLGDPDCRVSARQSLLLPNPRAAPARTPQAHKPRTAGPIAARLDRGEKLGRWPTPQRLEPIGV